MARDYAAVPHEYLEEMAELDDAEFGRLTRALLQYSRTGKPIALKGNEAPRGMRVRATETNVLVSVKKLCKTDGKNATATRSRATRV